MDVGFTGTKKGMSVSQKTQLRFVLKNFKFIDSFHHGDCVGADKEAEKIFNWCVGMKRRDFRVQRHPAGGRPLERDKEIVAVIRILIAAPRTNKEVLRSGTWATVRYARTKGIPVIMLTR